LAGTAGESAFRKIPGVAGTVTAGDADCSDLVGSTTVSGKALPCAFTAILPGIAGFLPREEVLAAATSVAQEIAQNAPLAVQATKRALRRSEEASIEDQLQFEASEQARNFESSDAREGIAAVREKRSPAFTGK